MAQLMVVQAASKLGLLQVSCDVFVRHFLKASLKKVDLLFLGSIYVQRYSAARVRPKQHRYWLLTSSSLQALPPPVDVSFRFFEMPYS